MRVLRVSHSGVVDVWREREREIRRAGVDVSLLCARKWDGGGAAVTLQPREGEPVLGVRTWGTHPALFVYDPRPIWHALGEDWDILDLHEEPFALATAEVLIMLTLRGLRRKRPRVPYVLYSAQNIEKRYPWPFRMFERRSLRSSAAVSVCNEEAGRIVRAKGARGLVEVIPLGVDLRVFHPGDTSRPQTGLQDTSRDFDGRARQPVHKPRVGYVGRLAPHKGVHVLVEAVAREPALTLEVVGAGPSSESLRAQALSAGERVRFHGPINSAGELADFYRSLDVLAVPSLATPSWVEQFGRVAVEAMACGVPVVASGTGALPDVVGEAGVVVPADDPDALRDALVRVVTDRRLARDLREAGLRRADQCSWPEVARRYVRVYEHIAGSQATDSAERRAAPKIIVVAYGSPELVRKAISPLTGLFPIVVVDNSSMPEIRLVADQLGVEYLDPGVNGGFAAGVNYALAHDLHEGRDVLLLNPDAVVSAADVHRLHGALRSGRRVASVGPRQTNGAGAEARVSWPYPSPLGTWLEAVGLGRLRRSREGHYFVIGSVLLLNRDALNDIGTLDERFFLYAEETDWAYRAKCRGWRHLLVAEAEAVHLGGATSNDPLRRETHFHASQERYFRKHFGSVGWQVARLGQLLGSLVRSHVLDGERRAAAARRVRLYATGPKRAEARMTGSGR